MVMWFNCMRFVTEKGIAVRAVERLARTRTNWDGMRRWGYVFFEPDPADSRPKPPPSALIVRATAKGRVAQELWAALIPAVEERWRKRFDGDTIDALRSALEAVVNQLDVNLPDCLPILKYGLVTEGPKAQNSASMRTDASELPLPALLARVLLAFALEFERESDVSLAICADVLRVVDEKGTPVRDLSMLGGISKEAVAMALSLLTKRGYARVQTAGRVKTLLLTPAGVQAHADYLRLLKAIEKRWVTRHGAKTMQDLSGVLQRIAGDGTAQGSPLFQ
jgi:DNA-binding MarR family transcriptional regulator